MTFAVKLPPPRKYPSEVFSSVFLVEKYAIIATSKVKPINEMIPNIFLLFFYFSQRCYKTNFFKIENFLNESLPF